MNVVLNRVKQIYSKCTVLLYCSDCFRECGWQSERPSGLAKSPKLILRSSQGLKLDPETEAITINKQQLTDTSRTKAKTKR
jgi:hypothetical protein